MKNSKIADCEIRLTTFGLTKKRTFAPSLNFRSPKLSCTILVFPESVPADCCVH